MSDASIDARKGYPYKSGVMPARRKPSKASRARRQEGRYLTPVIDAAGAVQGYRFNPGPHLRAKGASSRLLQHADGRWLSFEEAKAFRDQAIANAEGRAIAAPTIETREPRTLNALWDLFVATRQSEIDAGDEEAIAPSTLKYYGSVIKPWLAFAGDDPAAALDAEIIEAQYKIQKRARGHNAAHASLRALQAVLSLGVRKWRLPSNPAHGLGLASPRGRLRLGTPEELLALVTAADALGDRVMGDAIVSGVWTGQRLGDLLDCDLARQLTSDGFLVFARMHEADFSQEKRGGQAMVPVLMPLKARLRGRTAGRLLPGPNGARIHYTNFNDRFRAVRAAAAKNVASVADFKFQDLRDTAITRLVDAGVPIGAIPTISGHSLHSIERILDKHYLVRHKGQSTEIGVKLDAWRRKKKVTV